MNKPKDKEEEKIKLSSHVRNFIEKENKNFDELISSSVKKGSFIESHTLVWSGIESFYLPNLIIYISNHFGIKLPKNIHSLPVSSVIYIYFCLSHDVELFNMLEEGRKTRNDIVHNLYKEKDVKMIKEKCKNATIHSLKIVNEILHRLNGSVSIPAMNLYSNGWNDALEKVIQSNKDAINWLKKQR